MKKHFKLSASQILPLAPGRGGAVASDRITVDGRPVGYMYRTQPRNATDSGWTFLAGDENDEDLARPEKAEVFDINTIANYDRDIIPFLDASVGSAFIRTERGFVLDPGGAPPE